MCVCVCPSTLHLGFNGEDLKIKATHVLSGPRKGIYENKFPELKTGVCENCDAMLALSMCIDVSAVCFECEPCLYVCAQEMC